MENRDEPIEPDEGGTHDVPADLLALYVDLEQAQVTPAEFRVAVWEGLDQLAGAS